MFLLVFGLQTPVILLQARQLQQLLLRSVRILVEDDMGLQNLDNFLLLNAAAGVVVAFQLTDDGPEIDLRPER